MMLPSNLVQEEDDEKEDTKCVCPMMLHDRDTRDMEPKKQKKKNKRKKGQERNIKSASEKQKVSRSSADRKLGVFPLKIGKVSSRKKQKRKMQQQREAGPAKRFKRRR